MRRDLLSAGVWYRFVQQQALQQHSPLWNWNKLKVLNPPQASLLLPLLVEELLEHGVHHRHLWSKQVCEPIRRVRLTGLGLATALHRLSLTLWQTLRYHKPDDSGNDTCTQTNTHTPANTTANMDWKTLENEIKWIYWRIEPLSQASCSICGNQG